MAVEKDNNYKEILEESECLIDEGDYKQAKWKLQSLLNKISRKASLKHIQAEAYCILTKLMSYQSDLRAGLIASKKAIDISKSIGNERTHAMGLTWKGDIYWKMGEYNKAMDSLNQAQRLANKLNIPHLKGIILNEMSNVYRAIGDIDKAIHSLREAVLILEGTNKHFELARIFNNLGDNLMAQDKYNEGIEIFERAIIIGKKLKFSKSIAYAHYNIAECQYHLNKYEESINHVKASFSLFKKMGDKLGIAICYHIKGLNQGRKKNWADAILFLEQAQKYSKLASLPTIEGKTVWYLGQVYMWKGDKEKAKEYLDKAHNIFTKYKKTRLIELVEMDMKELD